MKGRNGVMIIGFLVIFALIVFALLYAYVIPARESKYQSQYLSSINDEYVDIPGFRAHYVKTGSGSPIILIHGGGSWLYSYRNNIDELSLNHTVYAVDMPGHGYTTPTSDITYNLDTYALFIMNFMDVLGIEKASFVGHSWGGGWSLFFAERYPKTVERLILLGSSGLNQPDTSEWRFFKYPIIGEIVSKAINWENTRSSLLNMVVDKEMITDDYVDEIFYAISIKENRKAQVEAEREFHWQVVDDKISQVDIPVLLIFGEKDCYFDHAYQQKMLSKFINAELFIIEDTSHLAHEEKYQEIDELIMNFLEE